MTVTQTPSPVQIEDIAKELQELFTQIANELAYKTKFVQRRSPITGSGLRSSIDIWLAGDA